MLIVDIKTTTATATRTTNKCNGHSEHEWWKKKWADLISSLSKINMCKQNRQIKWQWFLLWETFCNCSQTQSKTNVIKHNHELDITQAKAKRERERKRVKKKTKQFLSQFLLQIFLWFWIKWRLFSCNQIFKLECVHHQIDQYNSFGFGYKPGTKFQVVSFCQQITFLLICNYFFRSTPDEFHLE